MGIWIKSQDRTELVNTQRIEVQGVNMYAYQPIQDGYIRIGEYESMERAKQVLDEIQHHIATLEHNKMLINQSEEQYNYETYVFEMPEN